MLNDGGCPLKCLCQGVERGLGLTVFVSCKVAARCGSEWSEWGFQEWAGMQTGTECFGLV